MEEKKRTLKSTNIKTLLSYGMPITCATCVFMHEALDKNDLNCHKDMCGGPLVGRTFPDYRGVIAKKDFNKICLICGDSGIVSKIIVQNQPEHFALCKAHKDIFTGLSLKDNTLIQIEPIIIPL